MIPLEVVEYIAKLFACGCRGYGCRLRDDGRCDLWLFGEHWRNDWSGEQVVFGEAQ